MRFHAPSVSASADGDYYQLSFGPLENGEAEDDPYDVRGPYLIVQRQFEMPDQGRCSKVFPSNAFRLLLSSVVAK